MPELSSGRKSFCFMTIAAAHHYTERISRSENELDCLQQKTSSSLIDNFVFKLLKSLPDRRWLAAIISEATCHSLQHAATGAGHDMNSGYQDVAGWAKFKFIFYFPFRIQREKDKYMKYIINRSTRKSIKHLQIGTTYWSLNPNKK